MKIRLNPKALTFGDMEDFETYTGLDLEDVLANGSKSAKVRTAMVWICCRADDPEFTIDDVRKLPMGDLEIEVVGDDTDPTPGDENSSSSPSA